MLRPFVSLRAASASARLPPAIRGRDALDLRSHRGKAGRSSDCSADGLLSLVRQWALRPEFWHETLARTTARSRWHSFLLYSRSLPPSPRRRDPWPGVVDGRLLSDLLRHPVQLDQCSPRAYSRKFSLRVRNRSKRTPAPVASARFENPTVPHAQKTKPRSFRQPLPHSALKVPAPAPPRQSRSRTASLKTPSPSPQQRALHNLR